jgi:hypothetical protein
VLELDTRSEVELNTLGAAELKAVMDEVVDVTVLVTVPGVGVT